MKNRPARTLRNVCVAFAALLIAVPSIAQEQMSVRQIAANAQMAVATVHGCVLTNYGELKKQCKPHSEGNFNN